MHRTLKGFAVAFALLAVAVVPATAEAAVKPKKTNVLYSHDEWTLSNMVNHGYGDPRKRSAFLPGRGSGKGGDFSFSGLSDFYQGLGMVCQVGGLGLTLASFASAAVGNVPGIAVGAACLGQQLLGLGMPPPPPITIRLPDKNQVIYVPMPEQPAPHEHFFHHRPHDGEPEKSKPVPQDVPTAKAPDAAKKAAQVPETRKLPKQKTQEVPPAETPSQVLKGRPQEEASFGGSRLTQFSPVGLTVIPTSKFNPSKR